MALVHLPILLLFFHSPHISSVFVINISVLTLYLFIIFNILSIYLFILIGG